MNINLRRPLIIFDLETTGLNFLKDRIVEISYIKLFPDGSRVSEHRRINPLMPIPKESSDVHHITDEDVADQPSFAEIADELLAVFEDSDLGGFNCLKFDVPMLIEEFSRTGRNFSLIDRKIIDVQNIFHKKEPRTLSAAYRFYCDREHEGAHDSLEDTKVTLEVLEAQLSRYPDLKNDVDFLAEFSSFGRNMDLAGRIIKNDDGIPIINFGKHKGKTVEEVLMREPSFYSWVMQGEFAKDTKDLLTALHSRYVKRKKKI